MSTLRISKKRCIIKALAPVTIEELFNKYGIFFPQSELEIKVLPPLEAQPVTVNHKPHLYRPNNADLHKEKWKRVDAEVSALLYQEGLGDTFKAITEWELENELLTLLNVYRRFYPSYVSLLQSKELTSTNSAQLWENCIYIKKQQLKEEKESLLSFLSENFSLPVEGSETYVLMEREVEKLEETKDNLFVREGWKDVEKIWALEGIIDVLGTKPQQFALIDDFRVVNKSLAETLNHYFSIPYLQIPEVINQGALEIYSTLSCDQAEKGLPKTPAQSLRLALELA